MVYIPKSRKTVEEKKMQQEFAKEEEQRKKQTHENFKQWKLRNPEKTMLDYLKEQ